MNIQGKYKYLIPGLMAIAGVGFGMIGPALAEDNVPVFQIEYAFGGKQPTRGLYLNWQSRSSLHETEVLDESASFRLPLHSSDPKTVTLLNYAAEREETSGSAGNVVLAVLTIVVGVAVLAETYRDAFHIGTPDIDLKLPPIPLPPPPPPPADPPGGGV